MFQTLRQAPFLRLVIFFSSGIICSYWLNPVPWYAPLCCAGLVLLFLSCIPLFHSSYDKRWLFGFGLSLAVFSSGCLLTRASLEANRWTVGKENHVYQFKLLDDPVRKSKTVQCKMEIINADRAVQAEVLSKRAVIYLPQDGISCSLHPGDQILARVDLDCPDQVFGPRGSGGFDYGDYLRKQGFASVGFVRKGSWEKRVGERSFAPDFRSGALNCRKELLKFIRRMIPDARSAALSSAMILGFRNDMDKELTDSFSATGVSHILSVSGMHVGILYGMFLYLFSFLGTDRKGMIIRQLIVILLLWAFAFLTGLSPSVVRSTVMLSISGAGVIFSRNPFTLNTIAASGLLMLLWNPLLLFDVSFQLSYVAVASIVVINPWLVSLYTPQHFILKYGWELSCVSIAAQWGTLPFTLYYFHQFPLVFLPANLFVIPLTGVLMVLIPFSVFLSLFVPVSHFLFVPVNWILSVYISGVQLLERIPMGVVRGIPMDLPGAFLLSLFLISCGMLLAKKRAAYLYLTFILAIFQVIYYL